MKYTVEVTLEHTAWYKEGTSILHREDGPAFQNSRGNKQWCIDGELHRVDGPAIEYSNGDKSWYINGLRHRVDGPAFEGIDGSKTFYQNDKRHRTDGPAIEYSNGYKRWFINDVQIHCKDNEEFLSITSPSCEGKIVEIDGKKYKLIKA